VSGFGTLDDLPESTAVGSARPSLPVAVGALALAGILIAGVAVFLVATATGVVESGRATCTVATPCTGLPLDDVERYAGLDFPDGSEVIDLSRASVGDATVFSATVRLPGAELPDFARYGYAPAAEPGALLSEALAGAPGVPEAYFSGAAVGVHGSAAQLDDAGSTVIVVDVRSAG
jgi:hypothetical protein